jgi:hypothetical protein
MDKVTTTIATFKVEYNNKNYYYTEWLDQNKQVIDYQIVDQHGIIPDNYDELIELIGFHLDVGNYIY